MDKLNLFDSQLSKFEHRFNISVQNAKEYVFSISKSNPRDSRQIAYSMEHVRATIKRFTDMFHKKIKIATGTQNNQAAQELADEILYFKGILGQIDQNLKTTDKVTKFKHNEIISPIINLIDMFIIDLVVWRKRFESDSYKQKKDALHIHANIRGAFLHQRD